mgnify:CR=1 FL=1
MNETRNATNFDPNADDYILSPIGALKRILGALEFEQRMYGKQDPGRSTIDLPRAIEIARDAIIRAEAE